MLRFPRTRMNVTKLTQAHVQPFLLLITEAFEMRNDKVFHCDGHKSINAGWHCAGKKKNKICSKRRLAQRSVCVCYCPLLHQLVAPSFELYLICYKRKTTVFFLLCSGLTSGCRCRQPPQTSQGFQGSSPAYPWRGRAAAGSHRQTL